MEYNSYWKRYNATPTAPSSGDGGILYVKNDDQLYYSSNIRKNLWL